MEDLKKVLWGLQKEAVVYDYEHALLYQDGKFTRILPPGKYRFPYNANVQITRVSKRLLSEVISGQEILTADRIGVRVSLIAKYQVTDPVLAVNGTQDYAEQLHQDLQLVLRDAVAARSVEQLLDARGELSEELMKACAPQAAEYGLTLRRVGVRDIVLPGQVRTIFMQEVEADRKGRAALVAARHEVAAARARANTAKILTENPAVLRLQEIDALVQLASKHGNVILLPNLADLLVRRADLSPSNGAGAETE
ncbi:MAG: slipin family protein [Anaerolineae bacterium]|nr:slipin family protein [Anaerolineae bacterium]MDW8173413.1 slipin family protein [Anaerolineae bacterium]